MKEWIKYVLVVGLVVGLVLCFLAGFLLGTFNHSREIEMLRQRTRRNEILFWEWRAELEALKKIGIEVTIHDRASDYALEYIRVHAGDTIQITQPQL